MDDAISYLRWSTPDQSLGDSDRRQIEWAQSWCEKNDARLVEVYRDPGVSAFRGKNRSQGALGEFLEAVKSGNVKPKFLIVENLDRLSRHDPDEAFDLLREIVRSGITLVTRNQVYSTQEFRKNPYVLQQALGEMIRAHAESQRKSEMLLDAHEQKRKRARENRTPITHICPYWLRLEGNGKREDKTFGVIPERAAIVRWIFDASIAGMGDWMIAKTLNKNGAPAFRGNNGWHRSAVLKVLRNRSVLGEYQPHQWIGTKRVPIGEPIVGYYPAIIDERTFAQSKMAKAGRFLQGGANGESYTNLVTRIGTCDCCGSKLTLRNKGKLESDKGLICSDRPRGLCSNKARFPYFALERMLLALHDLTSAVASVIPPAPVVNSAAARLEQLSGDIEIAKHRLRELMAQFSSHSMAAIRDAAVVEVERVGSEIEAMQRQQLELQYQVKAADRQSEQSLLARVSEAKKRIAADDINIRVMSRATIVREFRRVIRKLVLHESENTEASRITVEIARGENESIEYDLRPEGVNNIRIIQKGGRPISHDRPRIMLVGPDGQTVFIGEDAARLLDFIDASEMDKARMAVFGKVIDGWKLVYPKKIDPGYSVVEEDDMRTDEAAE